MSAANLFMDFGIMSIVIIVAHLIRYVIKPFQSLYIPTSILAGFIGLFCGYQFLDILPFSLNAKGTPNMISYPGILIVILYSTLFLGGKKDHNKKFGFSTIIKGVGDTFFNCWSVQVAQYGVAILFGLVVLNALYSNLPVGFAVMMPSGFVGGHGVATSIGTFFADNGWPDAMTVGYTFATAGLLIGLFGGIILINIAARRGWTKIIDEPGKLPQYMLTSFVPQAERGNIGQETVHSIALDSLTWHFAIIMVAYAIGGWLVTLLGKVWSYIAVPHFATAMIVGFFIQKFFDALSLGKFVDKKTINTIGSCATDYLVAFAVATMDMGVVLNYAMPLAIMILVGTVYCLLWTLLVGPRIYHNYWFERSIFVYGFATGVMATGVTLLRVVDPEARSGTLEDYGIAYVGLSFLSIAIPVLIPALVIAGQSWMTGIVLTALGIVGILLSRILIGWWNKIPLNAPRIGEKNYIE